MSNTDFITGICENCGKKKEEHKPSGVNFYCYGIPSKKQSKFKDSGLQQVEDNAVRVLRAAKQLLDQIDGVIVGHAVNELKSACEASIKRD